MGKLITLDEFYARGETEKEAVKELFKGPKECIQLIQWTDRGLHLLPEEEERAEMQRELIGIFQQTPLKLPCVKCRANSATRLFFTYGEKATLSEKFVCCEKCAKKNKENNFVSFPLAIRGVVFIAAYVPWDPVNLGCLAFSYEELFWFLRKGWEISKLLLEFIPAQK